MAHVEPDIADQLRQDFGAEEFPSRLAQLVEASGAARVQRSIVFAARGHAWYFDYLCKQAQVDFRDVIMTAECDRLNAHLYDFSRPLGRARIEDPTGQPYRTDEK